jgi:hypothetical protein
VETGAAAATDDDGVVAGVEVGGVAAVVAEGAGLAPPVVAGFGGGGAKNALYAYRTRKQRTIARRYRRSIQASVTGNRVETVATERVASDKTSQTKPGSAGGTVDPNGFGHVIRTRRLKPAATEKER